MNNVENWMLVKHLSGINLEGNEANYLMKWKEATRSKVEQPSLQYLSSVDTPSSRPSTCKLRTYIRLKPFVSCEAPKKKN